MLPLQQDIMGGDPMSSSFCSGTIKSPLTTQISCLSSNFPLLLLYGQYRLPSPTMRATFLSITAAALFTTTHGASSAVQGTGSTTRGWSCCKNSCSWSNKAPVNQPVLSCDAQDNILDNPARRDGCDSGGGSYSCSDLSPWAASADLAYGFAGVNLAASNETAWCCSCYA